MYLLYSIINDVLIKLGQGLSESPAKDLGLVFTRGDGSSTNTANKALIWDESADTFAFVGANSKTLSYLEFHCNNAPGTKESGVLLVFLRCVICATFRPADQQISGFLR